MKRVLVVDDTKNIRNLLTTCLELNGYEVITAVDGHEALSLFYKEEIDLAFLDIKLPEISGTEVLRRIRAIGINVPIVIMTAFATVRNAVECTKLGAVAYLQKPFTADKVKNVLAELNNYSECSKENVEDYLTKSKALISTNNLNEAYTFLKKALSLEPSCSETYKLIGQVKELENNLEEAQKFYNIAKQLK